MKASKYKKYAESKGYDFNDLVQEKVHKVTKKNAYMQIIA